MIKKFVNLLKQKKESETKENLTLTQTKNSIDYAFKYFEKHNLIFFSIKLNLLLPLLLLILR